MIHGDATKPTQKLFLQVDPQKRVLQLEHRNHIHLRKSPVHCRDHCNATPKRRSFLNDRVNLYVAHATR